VKKCYLLRNNSAPWWWGREWVRDKRDRERERERERDQPLRRRKSFFIIITHLKEM